jgi:hypothetical protein
MRKLYLTLAALSLAAAVGVGAVVAFAQGSSPQDKRTGGGVSRPSSPTPLPARPADPQTGGG